MKSKNVFEKTDNFTTTNNFLDLPHYSLPPIYCLRAEIKKKLKILNTVLELKSQNHPEY